MNIIYLSLLVALPSFQCLIVNHNFLSGVKVFSYQTFSGVAMYSKLDAPSISSPGNGHPSISFDLQVYRGYSEQSAAIQLIIIPDINIDDIGIKKGGQLHLCCTQELIDSHDCTSIGHLIVNKNIPGMHAKEIQFEESQDSKHFIESFPVDVTAIHVFAMASCDENLGEVTFEGQSIWMNPYGHLPGDVYGYLPFYGWMCLVYLLISVVWFCMNAIYWKELMHVQNCITGVLALLLIEMATWYFHYLHLNEKGVIHHGPFILGLITTVTRRMVARMLVVAVALGYGVVKSILGPSRNKILVLGVIYWIFAFMFEALIHYNQTEKVETWMRTMLIPPVAIVNGIFWWWTFVALNRTIEKLRIRKQTSKLKLYKSFTLVLVIALIAAIAFAIYEMYYVLKQLYFAEWQRLWFMEVGFWQILFSAIFVTIMFLWRPSLNFKDYINHSQLKTGDFDEDDDDYSDEDEDEKEVGGTRENGQESSGEYSEEDERSRKKKRKITAKFMIGVEDEDVEEERKPNTTVSFMASAVADIADGMDNDTKLAAHKMN